MKYQIQSDNMELTPSMSELAKAKMEKLTKHFKTAGDNCSARIVMNTAPVDSFEVRISLVLNGKDYFGDDKNFNLETALINAVEELDRQLEKAKSIEETEWKDTRDSKRAIDSDPELTE